LISSNSERTSSAVNTSITNSVPTLVTNGEYNVTFQQIGACPPNVFWGIPWTVTIGGVTKVQPSNTTLPVNNSTLYGTNNRSYAAITFFLDKGNYSYTINPSFEFFTPDSGTITVNGNETLPITYTGTSCTAQTNSSSESLQRSGPISTYPAAWGLFSSCPGFPTQGNITTLGLGNVTYPNSWNTTTIVTLNQVYESIISSSVFTNVSSGHRWVVYSWSFIQGSSSNLSPNSTDIVGYFILTNAYAPDGYVTAYYNIENGSGALSSVSTTVTVYCPSFSTSSITTTPI